MGNFPSQVELGNILRPTNLIILFVTLYGGRVVRRILQLRTALAGVDNLPGDRLLYGPYTIISRILPSIPYINRAGDMLFKQKYARKCQSQLGKFGPRLLTFRPST